MHIQRKVGKKDGILFLVLKKDNYIYMKKGREGRKTFLEECIKYCQYMGVYWQLGSKE